MGNTISYGWPTDNGPELPIDNADTLLTSGLYCPHDGETDIPDSLTSWGLLPSAVAELPPPTPSEAGFILRDSQGNSTVVSTATQTLPLGSQTLKLPTDGSNAIFAPGMLPQQAANPSDDRNTYQGEDEIWRSYSGSDMRVLIEVADPNPDPAKRAAPRTKQVLELSTLTVSIHRVKAPVRACGYINPRGIARGSRTIAGTLILTQFTVDLMYRFLYSELMRDLSKDSLYLKPDQLPPFDLTLMFSDEYGNASYRRLLGVDVVTDGVVYSQNDMFAEQTISYMAADFTPLLPLNRSSLLKPVGAAAAPQRTPMMVMTEPVTVSDSPDQVAFIPSELPSSLGLEAVNSTVRFDNVPNYGNAPGSGR